MKNTTIIINDICNVYNKEQKKMWDAFGQYGKTDMRDLLKEHLLGKYIIDAKPIRMYLHNLMIHKKRCDMRKEICVIDTNDIVVFLESIIKRG